MRFEFTAFGPVIGFIMVIDVTQQETGGSLMDD
jgi:hypothetical protein